MFTYKLDNDSEIYIAQGYNSFKPKRIKVLDMNIPYSHYHINSNINTLILTNEVTLLFETITLTKASYSSYTDFASQLQTNLNTNALGLVFTVTFNKFTHKLTITESLPGTNFTITANKYLLKILGMTTNTLSGAFTYISNEIVNMNIFDEYYITIYINNFGVIKNVIYEDSTYTQNTLNLYSRQGSLFGEYQEYDFKDDNILLVDSVNDFTVASIKIVIKDYSGNIIDFNGQNIFLTLNYQN